MTLDGVPQNDPFGGWVIWTGLPPETIASAAVVRGAGSGPYGAGALTGVVALRLAGRHRRRRGRRRRGRRARLCARRRRRRDRLPVLARGSSSTPPASAATAGSRSSRAAARSTGRSPCATGAPASASSTDLGGGVVLSERVAGYQEERGAGTIFAGSEVEGAQGSVTLVKQPAERTLGWRLQAWASGSNLVNTSASVARRPQHRDAGRQPVRHAGLRGRLQRRGASQRGRLTAGSSASMRATSTARATTISSAWASPPAARVGGGGEWIAGAYAEGSRTLGPLLLTGGVRLDGWETYDSSLVQTGKSRDHPASGRSQRRRPDRAARLAA